MNLYGKDLQVGDSIILHSVDGANLLKVTGIEQHPRKSNLLNLTLEGTKGNAVKTAVAVDQEIWVLR